jgi:signal transduction histidine kinase
VAGSLRWALVLLGVTSLLVGGIQIAVLAQGGPDVGPVWAAELFPATASVYMAAGLVAWWRRPSNRLGTIMVVGGLSRFTSGLESFNEPVLAAIGVVLQTVLLALAVHLLLAFPSGRLRSTAARWTVASAYLTSLVLQVPLYLFDPQASPGDMLSAGNHPGVTLSGVWLQRAVGILIFTAVGVILTDRLRRASRRQRRVLGTLYLYGMVSVLLVPLLSSVIQPLLGVSSAATGALQLIVLMGIPVAFASVLLFGGFVRTGEIRELGAWLSTTDATRPSLAGALARALGDDSLKLGYWVAEREAYVDHDGRALELPDPRSGRNHVEISLGDRLIGAVIYDAVIIVDPALVEAAGQVVAVALDHERLTAELLPSRDQLMESRVRLVEGGDRERRRIAQNLHDGLQMKLVLLAMEAQRLASQPGGSKVVVAAATTLRSRIDGAAAELRQLVHDVMPAPLIEGGLGAATQDLVDRLPLPTHLSLGVNGSLPEAVSSTAYFVVAEGLANAVKHAKASSSSLDLAEGDGVLRVEVSDDGVGGVAVGGGLGLRSLADRVDVLGGRLSIRSPLGEGTRLVVELPCGS